MLILPKADPPDIWLAGIPPRADIPLVCSLVCIANQCLVSKPVRRKTLEGGDIGKFEGVDISIFFGIFYYGSFTYIATCGV